MGMFAQEAAGSGNNIEAETARLVARMDPAQVEQALEKLTRETVASALGTVFTRRTAQQIPVPAALPPVARPRVPRTNTGAELL